jgi:hypothetical protein
MLRWGELEVTTSTDQYGDGNQGKSFAHQKVPTYVETVISVARCSESGLR